jgi:hypothetical protein
MHTMPLFPFEDTHYTVTFQSFILLLIFNRTALESCVNFMSYYASLRSLATVDIGFVHYMH